MSDSIFDEYDFMDWVDREEGFSIRKHWVEEESNESRDQRVQELVNDLSPMELVCYLVKYLTKKNNE